MAGGRLKHFGWGREGEGMTEAEETEALDRYRRLFNVQRFDEQEPPALTDIRLPPATPRAAFGTDRDLLDRALRSRRSHLWQVVPRLCKGPCG